MKEFVKTNFPNKKNYTEDELRNILKAAPFSIETSAMNDALKEVMFNPIFIKST